MPLVLTAHTADATTRRLLLRLGQEAKVGSSRWVELSLPEDDRLAEEHFVVRCQAESTIEVLNPQQTLVADGNTLDRLALSSWGETSIEFVAGCTTFLASWTPELAPHVASVESHDDQPDETESPTDQSTWIAKTVDKMSLSDQATDLRVQPDTIADYLDRLVAAELSDDAIRLIASILPTQQAVGWAMELCKPGEDSSDPLFSSIIQWKESGSEKNRVLVRDRLAVSEPSDCLGWLAKAVIFSGGSLAPDDQDVIPPPAHLTAIAIVTAHRWALASANDRTEAMCRWIDVGQQYIAAMVPTAQSHNQGDGPCLQQHD